MSLKLTVWLHLHQFVSVLKFSEEPIRRSKGSLNYTLWKDNEAGTLLSMFLPSGVHDVTLCSHSRTYMYSLFHVFLLKQTTVKKNIKKEEAEELKQKLEAVGATIEIV